MEEICYDISKLIFDESQELSLFDTCKRLHEFKRSVAKKKQYNTLLTSKPNIIKLRELCILLKDRKYYIIVDMIKDCCNTRQFQFSIICLVVCFFNMEKEDFDKLMSKLSKINTIYKIKLIDTVPFESMSKDSYESLETNIKDYDIFFEKLSIEFNLVNAKEFSIREYFVLLFSILVRDLSSKSIIELCNIRINALAYSYDRNLPGSDRVSLNRNDKRNSENIYINITKDLETNLNDINPEWNNIVIVKGDSKTNRNLFRAQVDNIIYDRFMNHRKGFDLLYKDEKSFFNLYTVRERKNTLLDFNGKYSPTCILDYLTISKRITPENYEANLSSFLDTITNENFARSISEGVTLTSFKLCIIFKNYEILKCTIKNMIEYKKLLDPYLNYYTLGIDRRCLDIIVDAIESETDESAESITQLKIALSKRVASDFNQLKDERLFEVLPTQLVELMYENKLATNTNMLTSMIATCRLNKTHLETKDINSEFNQLLKKALLKDSKDASYIEFDIVKTLLFLSTKVNLNWEFIFSILTFNEIDYKKVVRLLFDKEINEEDKSIIKQIMKRMRKYNNNYT